MDVVKKFLFGLVGLIILVVFLLFLSKGNVAIFEPAGIIALAEKNLLVMATLLMLIVIVPVFIMLFSFAWYYRADNTKAKYTPEWTHNPYIELVWLAIPFAVVFILSVIAWRSTHELDQYRPIVTEKAPLVIQVVALDWKWLFIYPNQNIATVNMVELPVGEPVLFELTSDAPMNSFWIPKLSGQIYAMAGMSTKLNVLATETGDFPGLSANFSGAGFSGMKFVTKVRSQGEFERWVADVKRSSGMALTDEVYTKLARQSKNEPVAYYASVVHGLYERILMKFMAPMPTEKGMKML